MRLISSYSKGVNKYKVEAHKKFSIPFACILFVLLGAPLGILANKGGFAVSTSMSFGFFLMYYILLIIGEELADRNILSPLVGMWTPNVVLMIVSYTLSSTIFVVVKNDSITYKKVGPLIPAEIISKKREGLTLDKIDIKNFIHGYLLGDVTRAQMSAFLMAVYFNGMKLEETLSLLGNYG